MITVFSALKRARGTRGYAVVAWGSNIHGQCGVPSHTPVLLAPQEILSSSDIAALGAGSSHSIAVTSAGEAYAFGSGSAGQLGLGRPDASYTPHRVETLVGRSHLIGAALGRHHTLFLDDSGALHACGISSSDASGSGGLLDLETSNAGSEVALLPNSLDMALQQAQHGRGMLRAGSRGGPGLGPRGGSGVGSHSAAGGGFSFAAAAAAEAPAEPLVPPGQLVPLVDHHSRSTELDMVNHMLSSDLRSRQEKESAAEYWSAARTTGMLGSRDAGAHRFSVPVRLNAADAMPSGPPEPHITAVASCSVSGGTVVLTSEGGMPQVLRAPPSERHAALLRPLPPCPLLQRAVVEGGGATAVAAGAGFFAALTVSGRVLLWLDHPVAAVTGTPILKEEKEMHGTVTLRALGNTLLAEFSALPFITAIAAGHRELIITDGSSVWNVPVHSAPGGSSSRPKGASPFQPQRVLTLADEGIESVAAGGSAAAAISGGGRLWVWGDVLSEATAAGALEQAAVEGHGHWAFSNDAADLTATTTAAPSSRWAGLGSPLPVLVPGLHGVTKIALGAEHALAEVA